MTDVLIASDAQWVVDDVRAVVDAPGTTVRVVNRGALVRSAVEERKPDIAILDLQIGKMGGMATCIDLHLEAQAGRLPAVPVLMLLDRRPDVFLARRAGANGWIVKPLDPIRLRKAVEALLDGGTYHDESHRPASVGSQPPQS